MSTKDLKRVLGFGDLMGVASGQIIGAGIMSLTGIAIAATGRSANIAFLISTIFIVLAHIPLVLYNSTLRLRGGMYTILSTFVGQRWAGFWIITQIVGNISVSLYAISLAQYIAVLLPGISETVIALVMLTVFFIVNYLSVSGAAKFQQAMMIILLVALAVFVFFGIPHVQWSTYFQNPGFTTDGIMGLLQTSTLLVFATGGAELITDLSGEAKNPKKDIPIVMLVSTLGIAVIYAVICTVAAGILPIEVVANQTLGVVAKEFLPHPLFVFFITGGGIFAIATTLNAKIGTMSKPLLQACDDGWFPKKLATLSKHKTPTYLLLFYYLVGAIPIIFNVSMGVIASTAVIISMVTRLIISINLYKIPQNFPEEWKESVFYVSAKNLIILSVVASCSSITMVVLLTLKAPYYQIIGTFITIFVATIFMNVRYKKIKDTIEISYETK